MPFLWKNRTETLLRSQRSCMAAVTALLLSFTLGACDLGSLLEVDLPGEVREQDLNDPALAETLVLSAVGDFECALVDYISHQGQWFEEFLDTSGTRWHVLVAVRSELSRLYADECSTGGVIWTPLQNARGQGQRAFELINSFPEESVEDRSFLLARARLYEAYSIQLLGEMHCNVTFDSGPLLSREDAWSEAEERFTAAIGLAGEVTGSRANEAAEVMTAAYIGRARARLNMGTDPTGLLADVSNVPEGFQLVATYDASPDRRTNKIYTRNNEGNSFMPHRTFLNLTLSMDGRPTIGDGVPDPRVMIVPGVGFGNKGDVPARWQQKYLSRSAPIPFATWREAQLMIAEVEGGQTAVNIINELRAKVSELDWVSDDHPSLPLPEFSSTDPGEIEATVQEERRRELWMQGSRAGDKLRWGEPFEDVDELGQPLGPGACMKIPFLEEQSNPNLAGGV